MEHNSLETGLLSHLKPIMKLLNSAAVAMTVSELALQNRWVTDIGMLMWNYL